MVDGIFGRNLPHEEGRYYLTMFDYGDNIQIAAVDSLGGSLGKLLLEIDKETGVISKYEAISKELGFNLGKKGTLKTSKERL